MRACGQGYSGLDRFTSLMDMPGAMTNKNYDKIVQKFTSIVKEVAEDTMEEAAQDIKECNGLIDTAVSCDGTWQRRSVVTMALLR